jgi:hypothetical protein
VGVALYSRKVLIKNKTDNILPKWLRFVKGKLCTHVTNERGIYLLLFFRHFTFSDTFIINLAINWFVQRLLLAALNIESFPL